MGISYEDLVTGTGGPDVIDLTSKPYSFFGYTLSGLGYAVETGDGDDTVYGTEHDDRLDGQGDDDTLYGNDGDDDIYGGDGNDHLFGGRGHDHIYGDDGDDTVEGNGGNDHIEGGSGNDTLYGDNHVLSRNQGGNPGNDYLFGDTGNDTIDGQAGTDTLRGGKGHDTLTGGADADRFEFQADDLELGWTHLTYARDPLTGGPDLTPFGPRELFGMDIFRSPPWAQTPWFYENRSSDTIKDFDVNGGDILDIASVLDVMTSFAGTTASDAISQGYVYWVQHGTIGQPGFGTTIYIDPNGLAANSLLNMPFALADLQGVAQNQILASHFDVVV